MTITDSKKSFVKCDSNQNNYLVNLITLSTFFVLVYMLPKEAYHPFSACSGH